MAYAFSVLRLLTALIVPSNKNSTILENCQESNYREVSFNKAASCRPTPNSKWTIWWTLAHLFLRILPKFRNTWFRGVFEPSPISAMELFCKNSYRLARSLKLFSEKKCHRRCSTGFSIYLCLIAL